MTPVEIQDAAARTPIHVQIYQRLRAMIEDGRLRSGQRVSSLRAMAVELGVARGTVQAAYDRLLGEGYLVARGPAGTFVADDAARSLPLREHAAAPPARPISARRPRKPDEDVIIEPGGLPPGMLQLGVPALDEFPRKLWTRLLARQVRLSQTLTNPSPVGHVPLREALTRYLYGSRGIAAVPEQLFVVPSYQAGLELSIRALALAEGDGRHRGSQAWVETPGYPLTAQVIQRMGLSPYHAAVDEQGLDVDLARRACPDAKLAVVTPSHQSPTGVALSLSRRMSLLRWAAEKEGWIFEDDYDGEYRYRGHPLPALKSLDSAERVLYCGTLSKVMFPGLRLAYVVVPPSLVAAFETAARRTAYGGCPELTQAAVAEFIAAGHFSRHIRRMRDLYARRRGFLATALKPYERLGFTVRLEDGGMHLLLDVPPDRDDIAMARDARAAGFGIHALSAWRRGTPGRRALMLGFTNLASPAQAEQQVTALMHAVDGATP